MGYWSTSLFGNDLALDVRDDYIELINAGINDLKAEEIICNKYMATECRDYPDEEVVFWFALAHTEWKKGRLSEHVKQKALACIYEGLDLRYWISESDKKKRQQVLCDLRNMLLSPMPPPTKPRRRTCLRCPWKKGDLLAYRIISNTELNNDICYGKYALLRVIDVVKHYHVTIIESDCYDELMFVGLYDWLGDDAPSDKQIEDLRFTTFYKYDDSVDTNRVINSIADGIPPVTLSHALDGFCSMNSTGGVYKVLLQYTPINQTRKVISCIRNDNEYIQHLPEPLKLGLSYTLQDCKQLDMALAIKFHNRIHA